jgi:PPM family protein phosphatase
MSSRVAYATSTGLVRERNEDSAYVGRWLCAVADGMGGHAAGDVASATVIDSVRPLDLAVEEPGNLTAVLGAAVRSANDRLAGKVSADTSLANMGSTLTALLWSGSHLAVANIGDSRAYLLRNGILRGITEDHVMSKLVADPMPTGISEYLVRFLDARPGWSPTSPCGPPNLATATWSALMALAASLARMRFVASWPAPTIWIWRSFRPA